MLVGQSDVMQQLRTRISRVARTTFTVLIEGESGAGKELVARALHLQGARSRGPLVAVNCAALVESLVEAELFGIEERTATGVRGRRGKFELADRGTLFLDEVGDLSPASQAKLLRVLQDTTVERVGGAAPVRIDTRVVAATNRSLHQMVDAGRFRADLFYRLSGVEIVVPPLRARREDIPELVNHFLGLHGHASTMSLHPSVRQALYAYDWPGNVRQLARVLERAIALAPGEEITMAELPEAICAATRAPLADMAGDDTLRGWSSRYVRSVLERCRGNKRRACDVLDISYHTLQSHLEYGSTTREALVPAPQETPPLGMLSEAPAS
ncbi:MAG: sigma-54 dependent transcriptional regulator [Vicinamibacterales bacterium]